MSIVKSPLCCLGLRYYKHMPIRMGKILEEYLLRRKMRSNKHPESSGWSVVKSSITNGGVFSGVQCLSGVRWCQILNSCVTVTITPCSLGTRRLRGHVLSAMTAWRIGRFYDSDDTSAFLFALAALLERGLSIVWNTLAVLGCRNVSWHYKLTHAGLCSVVAKLRLVSKLLHLKAALVSAACYYGNMPSRRSFVNNKIFSNRWEWVERWVFRNNSGLLIF